VSGQHSTCMSSKTNATLPPYHLHKYSTHSRANPQPEFYKHHCTPTQTISVWNTIWYRTYTTL